MHKHLAHAVRRALRVAAAVLALVAVTSCASSNGPTPILETGSTLLYPLMNVWVSAYQAHHTSVAITTQGTGSGTGISQAISGVAQIGASDAYTPKEHISGETLLNIPLAISAQLIAYNLPEIAPAHLRLSGAILADIYSGTLQYWDDPRILAANPALRGKLPHHTIVAIHRSDGSGDTFLFTQYLSNASASWRNGPGFGTSVSWPPSSSVGANGNPGVLQTCESAHYSIAYIGISFLSEVETRLAYAALLNPSGAYVLPTTASISSAAKALARRTPADARISIVDAPGAGSYPIVNYEYAIVNQDQPDAKVRRELASFLRWTLSVRGGQRRAYLGLVHFIPLPPSVARVARAQVARIR